jgi:hypothetical protein
MKHGDEAEMILKPGKYLARVSKKFTVEGEVDPAVEETTTEHPIEPAIAAAQKFAEEFKLPEEMSILNPDLRIWGSDAFRVVGEHEMFKKLILNSTTTAVVHAFDKLIDFYNTELKAINEEHLRADKHAANEERGRKVAKLKKFMDVFSAAVSHSKFKSEKNPKARGKRHELSGEEFRATISAFDVKTVEADLLRHGRVVDSSTDRAIVPLANAVGVKLPPSAPLSRFGAAKQEPVINDIISKFFEVVGVSKPEDKTEAIKTMLNLVRKGHRNYVMLEELKLIKKQLEDIK